MNRTSLATTLFLALATACAATSTGCSGGGDDPAPFEPGPGEKSRFETDTGVPWLLAGDPTSHDLRFVGPKVPVRMGAGSPESMTREPSLE